jgi:hypothetical protein
VTNINEQYPLRIVTFIDLLGFSRDVCAIEKNAALFVTIDVILRRIAKSKADIDRKRTVQGTTFDTRMTYFSDCMVLSYRKEAGAVMRALWDAAFLGQIILRPGYLPRGYITVGRLFHDDFVVYGGGLVEAVQKEKDMVSPRIGVSDEILRMVRHDLAENECSELESAFIRDFKTGPFVHVLGTEWSFLKRERELELSDQQYGDGIEDMFQELRNMIPLRYQQAPDDRAREKLEWMRDYVNQSAVEHGLPAHFQVAKL